MKLPTQDGTTFDWPDDWPMPTLGAWVSPLLAEAAFAALKANIEKEGLHDKIHFTRSGKIAKGRNRYRALRELGKTHDEIVKGHGKIATTNDESDLLSNILRVHRSKTASLASFFIICPGKLRDLISDRKRQQKTGAGPKRSGLVSEIATKLGCSPAVVTRLVDYLATFPQERREKEAERVATDESFSIPEVSEVETSAVAAENERSELSESIKNDEKRDRRKLPEETKQAIVDSLESGASISETAREHEVSKSVVHKLKKEQDAKPEPTALKDEDESKKTKLENLNTRINKMILGGESKTTSKPEVETLRKAFVALRVSFPVFKEWATKIHSLNISGQLFREYLDEIEP
jgi:transposase-like protein